MDTIISNSPEATLQLGVEWGRAAASGLVIGLFGDLGAGKTLLVKGIAQGMGIREAVSSPTFALVNVYDEGRLPLYHLDLYRLDGMEQILAAGLEEYFSPQGVSVIEWMDRWQGPDPLKYRRVGMEWIGESQRRIEYEDLGA